MKKTDEKPLFTAEELEISPWDVSEILDNEELISGYLEECLEDPDPRMFLSALGAVAKARSMTQLAKDTGLAREALYRVFQSGKKPQFETILKITRALGVPLGFPKVATSNDEGKEAVKPKRGTSRKTSKKQKQETATV